MTGLDRRSGLAAVVLAFAAISLPPLTATPALAESGVAPFCIAYGGGGEGGGGRPEDCRYYDWQACLQAAASRGNCVQNIDYHGTVSPMSKSPAPTAAPVRSRRRH